MQIIPSLRFSLAIVLSLCLVGWAYARQCFCHHCGCDCTCRTICRLVCEEKKVDVVCWGAKCEEFCLPCAGIPCYENCEMVCNECCDCDPGTPNTKPKKFVWIDWKPTKAQIFTRSKLMKKTITKTVPSYHWEVEELCPYCEARCECASVGPNAKLPPVPVADTVVKYHKLSAEPNRDTVVK